MLSYTIMHVDDRAKDGMKKIHERLCEFEYIKDIEFFDGRIGKAWDVLNHRGIPLDVWAPYDGREHPPLPGELGVWVSTLNVFEYMRDKAVPMLLVLEDDVTICEDFVEMVKKCISELPENFDFLSLYSFENQNEFTSDSDIGSTYIHKSINQPAAAQAIIYSLSGAKKLLRAVFRKGIEYTNDCFIFRQSQLGVVNGYSIRPEKNTLLNHEYKSIVSTIDPENIRNTLQADN